MFRIFSRFRNKLKYKYTESHGHYLFVIAMGSAGVALYMNPNPEKDIIPDSYDITTRRRKD